MIFKTKARLRAMTAAAVMATAGPAMAYPVAGDTFNVALTGQYQGGSQLFFNLSGTLGSTQTFAGAGYEGQDITVTSIVAAEGPNTRLTFTVSTPVDFMLTTHAGLPNPVVGYVMNIGGVGTIDPVNFTTAPTVLSAFGGWNGGTQNAGTVLSGSTLTGSVFYTTNSYSLPAANTNINSGTYSVLVAGAPAAVPEPAMLGLFGVGSVGLGLMRRRGRRAA